LIPGTATLTGRPWPSTVVEKRPAGEVLVKRRSPALKLEVHVRPFTVRVSVSVWRLSELPWSE
jgi:hypothetical protein